jgi:dTDP-4-dehydrorhamnose 3,5-epimerase
VTPAEPVTAPIAGVRVLQLRKFADERGWFCELRRESWYRELSGGRGSLQTNLSFSHAGVVRGLHWHRRGQDDLFFCPVGRARVVLFDRREDSPTADTAWSIDIDEDNCLAVWIPGQVAHGFEALSDLVFCYHVSEEYDPAEPDEWNLPWNDPRVVTLWSTSSPILSARDA